MRLADLILRRKGPLTRDLLREPGRFGLGQVPVRLAPDATTTISCAASARPAVAYPFICATAAP
jgi:hypothetical protein